MKYRDLGTTDLSVSEVGFGVWTVSTGWWGKIEEPLAVDLLVKAFDYGVNLFDTADTYGLGYGEEILAKALKRQRHDIVIGTKFGYDFYTHQEREGHTERPQDFSPEFIRYACEQSLRRLDTDYIDLYQLHNPRIDTIEDDEVFHALDELVEEGKIRHYGVALGPDIGWFEEGEAAMTERHAPVLQIIYSILEQDPARRFFPIADSSKTGLLTRVPHASGLLDGTYTKDTVFGPGDHRSHRRTEWLEQGLRKLAQPGLSHGGPELDHRPDSDKVRAVRGPGRVGAPQYHQRSPSWRSSRSRPSRRTSRPNTWTGCGTCSTRGSWSSSRPPSLSQVANAPSTGERAPGPQAQG